MFDKINNSDPIEIAFTLRACVCVQSMLTSLHCCVTAQNQKILMVPTAIFRSTGWPR